MSAFKSSTAWCVSLYIAHCSASQGLSRDVQQACVAQADDEAAAAQAKLRELLTHVTATQHEHERRQHKAAKLQQQVESLQQVQPSHKQAKAVSTVCHHPPLLFHVHIQQH